jgi:hypothetical protein
VVGAGSAVSVMASRLYEDSSKPVLLLECGLPENFVSDKPVLVLFLQRTSMDWNYETEPQSKTCFGMKGRKSLWPRVCFWRIFRYQCRGFMRAEIIETITNEQPMAQPVGRGLKFFLILLSLKIIATQYLWPLVIIELEVH